MSFFDKLRTALTGQPGTAGAGDFLELHVRCRRCNEILTTRVNLVNDLSESDDGEGYFVRKVLVGSGANRCFERIEITLTFDRSRHLIGREATGGFFVDDPTASTQAAIHQS